VCPCCNDRGKIMYQKPLKVSVLPAPTILIFGIPQPEHIPRLIIHRWEIPCPVCNERAYLAQPHRLGGGRAKTETSE